MTNLPCIAGIDPGSKGAVAFLCPGARTLAVYNLPTFKVAGSSRTFTHADAPALADLLRLHRPTHVGLERVHSMPDDGAVGAFSFGENFGVIKGVLGTLGLSPDLIEPSVWKSAMKVPADKQEAKARACKLFPDCAALFTRPDKAEAALIALYTTLKHGFRVPGGVKMWSAT